MSNGELRRGDLVEVRSPGEILATLDEALVGPTFRSEPVQMETKTVAFLGNFGTHNLGNECTLQSVVQGARTHLPGAALRCICPGPEDAAERHGIAASRMSYRDDQAFRSRTAGRVSTPVVKWARRLLIRAPLEFVDWLEAFRALRGTTMLVMPGTGMLGDFGIEPLGLHYQILKWSIVARLRGCKVLFVSVGAGPIENPLSRWIVKRAISLADYRSYRDRFSRQYLDGLGFDTSRDRVYPDLAFSFAGPATPLPRRRSSRRVVGLGLMDYYGRESRPERGESIYQGYLQALVPFVAWLLERDYSVRLIIGDLEYDKRVKGDLLRMLAERSLPGERGRILDEPISSPEQLWGQLAQTDVVVATRFHNVLLALMLDKPVLALSYHEKVESLMAGMGLAEYCHRIVDLDAQRLRERFAALEESAESLQGSIHQKTGEYRAALDEQYRLIFNGL